MYLIQTVQSTWRPQLPLPKEPQLADEQQHKATTRNNADNHNELSPTTNNNNHNNHNNYNNEEEEVVEMERLRHNQSGSLSGSQQLSNKQKWSFGRLFRKKKELESASSSEEDRKAGFVPKPKAKPQKAPRQSKTFDHIVMPTQQQPPAHPQLPHPQHLDNEFFLPLELLPAEAAEPYYQNQQQYQPSFHSRSTNSLDRRLLTAQTQSQSQLQSQAAPLKSRSMQRQEEAEAELISLNSSTFSKYRSDESIHSGGQALFQGQGQGQGGQSRRSRAARNERYYKRLSRDGEQSHGGVPALPAPSPAPMMMQAQPPAQRWKTQPVPLSIYQAPPAAAPQPRLRNTSSLQNVQSQHYVQWQPQPNPPQQLPAKSLQNTLQGGGAKRSISYDSHIHLQNASGRLQSKPLPPPPPPRDPLRRVQQQQSSVNGSASDLRPVSYACERGLGGRCVSDDRIWQPQMPHYQSVHSLHTPTPTATPTPSSSLASAPSHRRFITRAERDAQPSKQSLPNGIDFRYMADATPRSRKPIHMLEEATPPAASGLPRTSKSGLPPSASDFWQQQRLSKSRADSVANKPRSISSSRVNELRSYPMPMYSEVQKPKRPAPPTQPQLQPQLQPAANDEVDNVICGSLHIRAPSIEHSGGGNYVEMRHRDLHKANSLPHPQYQQRRCSGEPTTPNKYEEYVAEKRELHQQAPIFAASPAPASSPPAPVYFPRKKPANLEEAINELEAIYKSLGLTEPAEPAKPKLSMSLAMPPPRVPTPSDFEKFALAHADSYDDEDSPTGEPDPVRDDVAYRQLQLANLQHQRAAEKQPPFGIPVGPIVPAPQSDYLHVEPVRPSAKKREQKSGSPDIVKDDLAVRALRKDPPGGAGHRQHFAYAPMQKKNRATRTQSANIYNLIQRDAAKPSGGDLFSYMELSRNIERAGSLSDLQKAQSEAASDVPATLDLLRKLKAQDEEEEIVGSRKPQIPFRHPSQGGAIAQLPERLEATQKAAAPVPAPRKSLTPEPILANHQMEQALNQIALDAQESSIKLSQELQELRKEALITAARPKLNAEEQKLEQELQEIEAVSEAAKRCGKMLLDTLPDAPVGGVHVHEEQLVQRPKKKSGKLIAAIDQVSEAANAVCEKILKDIVTTEPPVIVHEALLVKQTAMPSTELVMPTLIKKLDPIQSDKIEAIAKRCMRQLSELADAELAELAELEAPPMPRPMPDYDNLIDQDAAAACNNNLLSRSADIAGGQARAETSLISTIAEAPHTRAQAKAQTLEEIDQIMQECERQAQSHSHSHSYSQSHGASTDDQRTTAPSISSGSGSGSGAPTASSFSSSSDCLAKSSSPTNPASRPLSSSITSFNPYSSSDYIKSPSSEYHAPSTDPIKTFSTTSYDVQSTTSATPNITNTSTDTNTNNNTNNTDNNDQVIGFAPPSQSPSPPPLQLTPVSTRRDRAGRSGRSSSPSTQYNSSEELAAIFGIEEQPKQRRKSSALANTGKGSNHHAHHHTATASSAKPNNNNKDDPAATSTNPCCAYSATLAPALNAPTNPVLNVELDVDVDVTTTIPPTNGLASSAIIGSSHSYKLATIPEQDLEAELETAPEANLKLSPNFNRIYASKVDIVVDRTQPAVETETETEAEAEAETVAVVEEEIEAEAAPPMTQFDSLSSLEETSSNPDSGNASLADFPLATHANASIELQTVYNSRFEIKEHYISEVSISATESTDEAETDIECQVGDVHNERVEDFPPLPTEEELLESLREEEEERLSVEQKEVDKTEENELELDTDIEKEQIEEEDIDIDLLINELSALSEDVYDLTTSEELLQQQFNELDSSDKLNESELDECDGSMTMPMPEARRKSIVVYETPQINLSISELKLNYETKVEQEAIRVAEESAEDDDEMPINDTSATAPAPVPVRNEEAHVTETGLPATLVERRRFDDVVHDNDDERPSTSSKALSVFGEVRRLEGGGGAERRGMAATAAQSLTTLEHVFVACTVGLITSNDLLTLCLIVIGVIIIIAIALT